MRTVKVGSRASELAVAQARIVMDAVRRACPDIALELVTMKTSGDKILDRPLDALGGKGLFVKELDDALRDGRVDITVHSYKDLPADTPADLPVVAASRREDPRDVLVLPEGADIADVVRGGKPVGTSSPRRRMQLERLLPGCVCAPVRGNIRTRLRKLDAGGYGALVLAAAGLRRLGLERRAGRVFGVDEMIPAACQGILAVQGRAGEDHAYLSAVEDADARDAAAAERAFVAGLGATCASPVAAYAEVHGTFLSLSALYINEDGEHRTGRMMAERKNPAALGAVMAAHLKGKKHA